MTLDIKAARALLAKLEKASGPLDPETACRLHALGDPRNTFVRFDRKGTADGGGIAWHYVVHWNEDEVPREFVNYVDDRDLPDRSTDAAIQLINSLLPEAAWGVSVEPPHHGVKYHAFVGDHFPHINALPGRWWGEAEYADGAALALCIALLRAVISKAESCNLVAEKR